MASEKRVLVGVRPDRRVTAIRDINLKQELAALPIGKSRLFNWFWVHGLLFRVVVVLLTRIQSPRAADHREIVTFSFQQHVLASPDEQSTWIRVVNLRGFGFDVRLVPNSSTVGVQAANLDADVTAPAIMASAAKMMIFLIFSRSSDGEVGPSAVVNPRQIAIPHENIHAIQPGRLLEVNPGRIPVCVAARIPHRGVE